MKVREVKVRSVVTASPDETVREAAERLSAQRLGTLIVVDELGRPLGIVTDRDLMERSIAAGRNPRHTRLGDVMSAPVSWAHDESQIEHAIEQMGRLGVRRLPIIDERERLVGILALDDVLALHFAPDTAIGRALRRPD